MKPIIEAACGRHGIPMSAFSWFANAPEDANVRSPAADGLPWLPSFRRTCITIRVIVVLALLLLLPTATYADKRVALVIGNSTYTYAGELMNPKNDATDMSTALKTRGFQVIDGLDLDKAAFD